MDKRQAIAQIAELTKQAQELLAQARKLAEENNFSLTEVSCSVISESNERSHWNDSSCSDYDDSLWMGSSC